MKHHITLLSLTYLSLLGQDVQGQVCSVTSTTTPPAYPTDDGFTTSGLVSMATATEVVTLQYTPNTPPEGFDDQDDCPYDHSGLLDWEDAATWTSGIVPGDGDDVVLPEDARVLLGGCSVSADTVYGKITIPASSELIFADEDIFFNTTGMQVEGKLTLGSESCRLHSDIVITLHGDRPDSLPAPAWYKGIAAVGAGVLDIHGSIFHPTWTRLAATAAAGDTQIYLQHRVNWRAGQRLVLTGTEIKDSRDWHRNEVREIANVQVNGEFSRITLTEALAYTHYGGPEYQGEVGLLSRNIVIQGDETSEPTDTDNNVCEHDKFGTYPCEHKWLTGYGGHTIAMGPNATTRFEGVELYRMGQTNVLARYPWHVHVIGEGGFRSYLKHSSMHHTFYRCATIHGTHNTLVQDNVAYDAIGHCFYSGEDGVEENNTVAFNLGSHVHFMEYPRTAYAQKMSAISSYENLTQPADTTASPFYITNAYNSYIGNAASGGYAGFAVVRLPKPIMVFRDSQTRSGRDVPHSLPFLAFEGNSCHSVGSSWWVFQSCIYVGGQLWHPSADSSALSYNPGRIVSGRDTTCTTADGSLVKCPLVMNNTKIFLSNIGINNWGARGSIDAFEAHDTMRAAAIIGSHYVHNMLTECRTSSGFVPEQPSSHYYEKLWHLGKHVGFEWYDTLQAHLIDGITFRNCGNAKKNYPVWRFLTHSDRYVPGLMQSSRRVKYENVDREALVMPSSQSLLSVSGALANWVDDDGTAFGGVGDGSRGPKLIGAARDGVEWWRLDSNCTQEGMWYNCDRLAPASGQRRGVGSFTAVVDPDVQAQFAANNICMNVGSTPCPRIGSAMHLGQSGDPAEVGLPIRGNAVVTGPTNGLGWLLLFDAGSPVSAKFSKPQIDEDDTVIIVMPYPAVTTFRVTYEAVSWCKPKYNTCEHVFTEATSLREMLDGVGDQYYFSASRGLFFVRFTPQKRDALDFSKAPGYGNLGLSYFEHDNMTRIPGTVSGGGLVIEASGCTLNATNENFCEKSEYDDTDICSEFGYPAGSTQIAYDTCVPSPAVVLPTSNPTGAPTTLAPTQTPTQPPTTLAPTQTPTQTPTTLAPTQTPTKTPMTLAPTQTPTKTPTKTPTQTPTTLAPTSADSQACTVSTMEGRYIGPTSKTVLVTVWEVDSVTACQNECRKHEACQAYNYQGEKGRCNLLRKDTHELLYKDAWTSGFFDCPGDEPVTSFCRHHDTIATGTLLRSFSTRWNYRYCQRQCLNDAACVHYVLQEGSCTLLSSFASSSPLSGATSGPRECKPL